MNARKSSLTSSLAGGDEEWVSCGAGGDVVRAVTVTEYGMSAAFAK